MGKNQQKLFNTIYYHIYKCSDRHHHQRGQFFSDLSIQCNRKFQQGCFGWNKQGDPKIHGGKLRAKNQLRC